MSRAKFCCHLLREEFHGVQFCGELFREKYTGDKYPEGGIAMEGISWEAVVGGGNSPRGNYSGVIVQGEFFWGNFIGGQLSRGYISRRELSVFNCLGEIRS